jgi:hypothetical protein
VPGHASLQVQRGCDHVRVAAFNGPPKRPVITRSGVSQPPRGGIQPPCEVRVPGCDAEEFAAQWPARFSGQFAYDAQLRAVADFSIVTEPTRYACLYAASSASARDVMISRSRRFGRRAARMIPGNDSPAVDDLR